ncbi:P-type conjugative transfer protein TrbJ [Pseudomonas lundensis]|uniref:P-type conjugative transfer protein TrbJ n=1 Tax=Pseudomonas lundensis TaxID=86185 RepID=UPI0018911459|nr:P-type conjugative transfer protein TrbJ [Pseudomonas lundensis]QOF92744.1 P-type conjugative transfer protein TrbJ [Pseudomonas lundensis]
MNKTKGFIGGCLLAIATTHLQPALAGIPVADGLNLGQTTISAMQSVAAVVKQIEQYRTQLMQYENMLQNTAAPSSYIWDQADQTITKLLEAQNTLSYYRNQAGSLENYLSKFQDISHYSASPCFGSQTCLDQDKRAIVTARAEASTARKLSTDALLMSVDRQQNTLQRDANNLANMQRQAVNAEGQMQAIQSANQLASAQANQLIQIRSLLVAQQSSVATEAQIAGDRESQQQAADQHALSGNNSHSAERSW